MHGVLGDENPHEARRDERVQVFAVVDVEHGDRSTATLLAGYAPLASRIDTQGEPELVCSEFD